MRQHSLQRVHILTDASTIYNKYIYLLMLQHSTTSIYIYDASAQPTTSTYTYWCVNSLQQVHILTDASSLQQVHILTDASTQSTTSTYTYWCVNTAYNKYIYLLMHQQSTTSTYTYWCISSLQQVHILTDASTVVVDCVDASVNICTCCRLLTHQ
jgi:hypothetical protein